MTPQERKKAFIEKCWLNEWPNFKKDQHDIIEGGWIKYEDVPNRFKYEEATFLFNPKYPETYVRPLTLKDMESNNGYTIITGPESLPPPGRYDCISAYGGHICENQQFFGPENNSKAFLKEQTEFWLKSYTHYRQRTIIPLPLY